jgi:biotin carboxyl carrier protein
MARTSKSSSGTATGTGVQTLSKASSNQEDANGESGDKKTRCKTLIIDGDRYRTRFNTKFENRKVWKNPNPKKITSSIPGTVIKLYVKVGQEVKKGDPILVLEAMKMKNKLLFHTDGKVKSIKVKEGEVVPKNHLMLELA